MEVIRYDAFETNSSSQHTLVYRKGKSVLRDYHINGVVEVWPDEYGWSGDDCNDFDSKLSYAIEMLLITEYPSFSYYDDDFTVDQEELESLDGYKLLLDAINEHGHCEKIIIKKKRGNYPYGYIDHQSYEDYRSLRDFFVSNDTDAESFLFDDNLVMEIDNDN